MLLIDSKGQGEYLEWTMQEFVDVLQPNWTTTHINFNIGDLSTMITSDTPPAPHL